MTNFTAAMGNTVLETGSSLGPANPLVFTIRPIPQNTTQTFTVGMDFPVLGDDSLASTGASVSNFQVSIRAAPSGAVVSRTATGAMARVFRALSLSHMNGDDLMFGRIAPLRSGNAFIKVTTAAGLTVGGSAQALTPTSARAALFTVVGEGSSRFSISFNLPSTQTPGVYQGSMVLTLEYE